MLEVGAPTSDTCDGAKPCSLAPVPVLTTAVFSSLTASQFATCGVTSILTTLCWGMDYENSFGARAGTVPVCRTPGTLYGCTDVPVVGPSGFQTLSGATSNHCGIKSDGIADCGGGNSFGQRGAGGLTVDAGPQVFSIAPGTAH